MERSAQNKKSLINITNKNIIINDNNIDSDNNVNKRKNKNMNKNKDKNRNKNKNRMKINCTGNKEGINGVRRMPL